MVHRLYRLLSGLVIDEARMMENLGSSHGLVFSQPVLLALVAAGKTRDEAYRIVQRAAMIAWEERRELRAVLEADPELRLPASALDEAFDLDRSLRHVGRMAGALDDIEL
jgi:adenylosuccinate lyase